MLQTMARLAKVLISPVVQPDYQSSLKDAALDPVEASTVVPP
jgi:hypothetical protein